METSREILHFLHYHPLSSRENIRLGINFQGSDATLKRLIAAAIDTGDIIVEGKARVGLPVNVNKKRPRYTRTFALFVSTFTTI